MLSSTINPIGGYIELQLPAGAEYYPSLLKLNTGRNALEYILRVKEFKVVYLPYFTCEVMTEPVEKLEIELRYYHIDKNLDPIIDFNIGENECFVYTNYFGIKQSTVRSLSKRIKNLIVDNAQAFFSEPLPGVDTFYSCRKFFGVPDGAYLQLNTSKRLGIDEDISVSRFSHLIKSIDLSIEEGYSDYIENNKMLCFSSIKHMSSLTQKILAAIDYEDCQARRNANFSFLHYFLEEHNELALASCDLNAPLVYPLLLSKPGLREELIARKIFVATYWPNVFDWTSGDMYENYLASNLIALPIDHRYSLDDMAHIVNVLNDLL